MVAVGMAENLHWDRTVLLENAKIKQEFQLMVESARRYHCIVLIHKAVSVLGKILA